MDTVETRKNIGFPSKQEQWCEAPAIYDEHTLRIAGHPVMEDWEQNYMDVLGVIAAGAGGRVLELGYGMGLSSAAIQAHDIDSHIVIECHPDVIRKAVTDFKPSIDNGKMHVYSGFWQDVTPTLASGIFDGILFDTYPLKEEEIHGNHFWFFEEAFRLLKPGGILTYYSDEATHLSDPHVQKLVDAGFKRKDIAFEICEVVPPADCEYWQASTIVAPIIRKAPEKKSLNPIQLRRRDSVKVSR
jgi:guanidinoacetate N-methyltransferase